MSCVDESCNIVAIKGNVWPGSVSGRAVSKQRQHFLGVGVNSENSNAGGNEYKYTFQKPPALLGNGRPDTEPGHRAQPQRTRPGHRAGQRGAASVASSISKIEPQQ